MKDRVTVGDAVVAELARAGVDTVFGIISVHNIPIYDALARHDGFRIVKPRGESGAVNMADAYARAGRKLGVVITSTGSGAGNAAGALIEADTAGTPLLHITGQVPKEYIDSGRGYIHECRDQLAMLKSISKQACRVEHPEEAPSTIRLAIRQALESPTGPVSVEIPIDYQSRLIASSEITVNEVERDVEPLDVSAAVTEIRQAERPVIWVGSGVFRAGATYEFRKFVDLVDAAVITSQAARGTLPETDRRCLGFFATDPDVRELLASADLLISMGTRFRGNETAYWDVCVPSNHIGIDIDRGAVNRNYSHSRTLIGDSRRILSALVAALGQYPSKAKLNYRREILRVREASRARMRENLGPYESILDAISETFPAGGIVVRDVTIPATTWASRMIEVAEPRQSLHASTVGIGQALPMAIGASIARPEVDVLVLVGDGGLLVNPGELSLIAEEGLSFTIVVFDDGGYGVLRNLQNKVFDKRRIGVDLESPDFVALARAFGMEAVLVSDGNQFRSALGKAVESPDAWMIVVDVEQLGTTLKPFTGTPPLDLYSPK